MLGGKLHRVHDIPRLSRVQHVAYRVNGSSNSAQDNVSSISSLLRYRRSEAVGIESSWHDGCIMNDLDDRCPDTSLLRDDLCTQIARRDSMGPKTDRAHDNSTRFTQVKLG